MVRPISTQSFSVSASISSVSSTPIAKKVHGDRSTLSSLQEKKEGARLLQWPKKLWNWFFSLFRKKEPIKKETGVPAQASPSQAPPSSDAEKIQEYQQEIEEKGDKIKKLKKKNESLSHQVSYYHGSSKKMMVLERTLEQQTNENKQMKTQLLKERENQAQLVRSHREQMENQEKAFEERLVVEREQYTNELLEQYREASEAKEIDFQERLVVEREEYKNELLEQSRQAIKGKDQEKKGYMSGDQPM